MALTTAQLQALKTDIAADPTLAAFANNSDGAVAIAKAYNVEAVPAFVVWRTDVRSSEVVAAITGTEFVALTAVKQQGLMLLMVPGTVDASSPNVRADFSAIFATGASLTALTALSKRNATRVEQLFATGTGSNGSPATMAVVGAVSDADVLAARNS